MEAATPTDSLPSVTCHEVARTLRASLPPPIADTPEDEARPDLAAIAVVASLLPANAEEAQLAALYVAAGAWALECLRRARQYPEDTRLFLQCTARSASMMREARSWRTALLRAQAERGKPEAAAAAPAEHPAVGSMADAPPSAEPAMPTPIAAAERYAREHRKRAMLIRRHRGVPNRLDFGPIPPEVVHAIVTGDTPLLRALDDKPRRVMAQAA